MDKLMEKLLIGSEKEYIKSLEPGTKVDFRIKSYGKKYTGIVSSVSDDLRVRIDDSSAPAGDQDIEIIIPEEEFYAH